MTEELKNENNSFWGKIGNYFRDSELARLVEELEDMLNLEVFENINKMYINNKNVVDAFSKSIEVNGRAEVSSLEIAASTKDENSHKVQIENINILARAFKVGDIINKFLEILEICHRESIYIFIDDYSELALKERTLFMDTIITPMYDIGVDKIYFKIACYPNKIEPIKLEKSKYLISQIDLFEIYGGDHNIANIQTKAIDYTKKLLNNSIDVFCNNNIDTYFDTKNIDMDEYYRLLYIASQNVSRVLGLILRNCYSKAIVYSRPITVSIINEASKKYYNEHVRINFDKQPGIKYETVETKVDIFVQESILDELRIMAQKNKYDLPMEKEDNSYFNNIKEANTSHFTLSQELASYIEDLEFDGFIHKVNKLAAKSREKQKYKNKTNYVYALDYGLCIEEKILYGRPKNSDSKYYQQRCFVYDDVIMSVLNNNKRIVCKDCGQVFPMDDLEIIQRYGMRCSECENGMCEIKFDYKLVQKANRESKSAVWSNQEFEVVNAINIISREFNDSVTVSLISEEIDYNYQLITWICKTLAQDGYIKRNREITPNTYRLSDRAKDILSSLVVKG